MAARTVTIDWSHALYGAWRAFWIGVWAALIAAVPLTSLASSAATTSVLQENHDAPSKHQPNEDPSDELTSVAHGSFRGMRRAVPPHDTRHAHHSLHDARTTPSSSRAVGFIFTSSEHVHRNGIGADLVC